MKCNSNTNRFRFDIGKAKIIGLENYPLAYYTVHEERTEQYIKIAVTIQNKGDLDIEERIAICTGIDSYMDVFPDWDEKFFPTMMRCEKTHFYGYCMTPSGSILGLACPEAIASYKLLYNGRGHRIHSVELDIINPLPRPKRYPQNMNVLKAGQTVKRRIYLFPVNDLSELYMMWEDYTGAPMISTKKWTYEIGERLQIIVSDGAKIKVCAPSGKSINYHDVIAEYGIYQVCAEKNGKISEALIYCRKNWDFYLKEARIQAIKKPQKATTHCESWYGLFSGYLAAKHYPNQRLDEKIENQFKEMVRYTFDFNKGEPLLLPERIQNTSTMISLLVDRYEANCDKDSLYIADRLSDFLIARQHRDGAYYRNGKQHYTCVIYIAKSMLELYLAERGLPEFSDKASKHFASARRAIDNLVLRLDNIGTEGEQTFEDGMISCSALQIGMFALLLDVTERKAYVKAAEYMMKKHLCLEQQLIPDCRMRCGSLRYWEAQYDILTKPNMMNSPHGWTAWTLYAYYYLYLLTGKREYLVTLMDGMGACVQLMELDGNLRWAFICDPYIEANVFAKDKKADNGYSGRTEKKVIGEEYLEMISGWFRHGKQKVTGGFLECPLYTKDETLYVDTQGGCCDNDVHEIFKCMEETVLKKAFIHFDVNGDCVCYCCKVENDRIILNKDVRVLVGYSDSTRYLKMSGRRIKFTEKEVFWHEL